MNLHEYQAKALLKAFGAPVPEGLVAFSADEAVKAAETLGGGGGGQWVIKAQIHAGGRGKAGGIKLVKGLDELKAGAADMIGKILITPQTGAQGKQVRRIYIEQPADIAREFYLSFLIDRSTSQPACIVSTEGGMDIEQVAAQTPEKILTLSIHPVGGVQPFHVRRIAKLLGLEAVAAKQLGAALRNFYRLFVDKDLSLLEINPLIITQAGDLSCLDAKISIDDNALFRHKDLAELRDWDEEDPAEREAGKHDLSFIKLDGQIGCMVNGAGLAMATMDIIKQHGAEPANFLDVGGGADKEKVAHAFQILLSDKQVQSILVNIFGGIMRCDIIAEGIIAAAREMNLGVPLIVRLEGTNVEKGKELLKQSGLEITSADDLDQAAAKAVELTKGN